MSGGINDDWARIHWIRDGFELLMGDPSWPLHDFRHVIRGRLGNPLAPDPQTLEFPIADISEMFDAPITTSRFDASSGPDFLNAYKPLFFGNNVSAWYEPPRTKASALEYTLSAYPVFADVSTDVWDDDNVLSKNINIASVDAATDTITCTSTHGAIAGYEVQWLVNALPAPLALNTKYYVIASGLTTTAFKLSATVGGSAIDLTTTTSGGAGVANGWRINNSTAVLTLAATPVGKVLVRNLMASSGLYDAASTYAEIMFTRMSISLNYKDTAKFTQLTVDDGEKIALCLDANLHTGSDTFQKISQGKLTWYGVTPDGMIQVGKIALPAATAKLSFIESDVLINSLRLVDTIRPIDFSKCQVSYSPSFFISPPTKQLAAFNSTGKLFYTPYSYGAASTPIDNYPSSSDADTKASFDLLTMSASPTFPTALATFYKLKLGIFEFQTRLSASELSIGDTISLTFPRLGWQQWDSGTPASPDNTATIDSRLAVVIGIETNLDSGPFPVKLRVFRQIPGYYPTANLN